MSRIARPLAAATLVVGTLVATGVPASAATINVSPTTVTTGGSVHLSGDVLAGIIAAYLAQGASPFEAASLGVYLHAAAGEALRDEMGDAGLLASELANRLPKVVKDLAAGS